MRLIETACLLFILVANLACSRKKEIPPLPIEIRNRSSNVLKLDLDGETHVGIIEVTDSILVAQIFDEETRQNPRLSVFNLKTKKWYGIFPWPDPQQSIYFGVAPYRNALIYFSNYQYFRKVDLLSKAIDTIPMLQTTSELVDMVIVGEKIYSLDNIYGINIVDLKNTGHQLVKRNYRGVYYNEQNSISVPVRPDLNLVSSCEIDSNKYSLYAVDSTMSVKWEKQIVLKDRFLQIRAFDVDEGFLVKYDNKLELISKDNGAMIWNRVFPDNIYNILMIDSNNVVLFLSSNSNGNRPLSGGALSNRRILKLNIKTKSCDWQIDNVGSGGESSFVLKGYLYDYFDDNQWIAIDLVTGRYKLFPFQEGRSHITVVRNRSSGNNYLFYKDSLYW